MNSEERPRTKRSISRVDYSKLADIKVPSVRRRKETAAEPEDVEKLYRLKIVDRNPQEGIVKVRYIGYGRDYDEWRLEEEVVDLNEESSSNNSEGGDVQFTGPVPCRISVFEELAYRIKTLLTSSRKGDPSCRIIIPFDQVSFDALVMRCSIFNRSSKRKVYRVPNMLKLNDLLGERWFIRGLNQAGDFCYIIHNAIKLYLKQVRGRPDYQLLDNGTMVKNYFGRQQQLVLSFVRGDGVASQWNHVVKGGH